MKPAGRLEPQGWMSAPETLAVITALGAEGAEVRFVGGCVRDAVARRPVKDIDLATSDPPERVMALLARAGIKAIPTGIDHGTVTAVVDGKPFEVTTLREDVEAFGRHARVAFTESWEADAARRDLTINALSCGADGTLYDPFGGIADLKAGRVRFVGDARTRIREDYLRLLRFFRFHAHYGRAALDAEGLAAAAELAPELKNLSGERVRDEILRLLGAPDPVAVLEAMVEARILAPILPELVSTRVLTALLKIERAGGEPDVLLRLAALLEPGANGAADLARCLRLPNALRDRLVGLSDPPSDLSLEASPADLHRLLYRLGRECVGDLLLLAWARRRAAGERLDDKRLARALAEVAAWTDKPFPLRGRDLQALGISKGPEIGRLLGQVEAWWESQDYRPTRTDCLARLKALMDEGR